MNRILSTITTLVLVASLLTVGMIQNAHAANLTVTLSPKSTFIIKGGKDVFTVTVKDSNKNLVSGAFVKMTVKYLVNGKFFKEEIATGTTNAQGKVVISFPVGHYALGKLAAGVRGVANVFIAATKGANSGTDTGVITHG
jgi:hypothetical protein